jgi:8-oxo-dGTP pyrophosphatase MutT (NUDIX family)
MNQEKSCGIILFRRERGDVRYLLVRSSSEKMWGFPKGHMEPGEEERETALRETHEEVDIRATVLPWFRETISYPVNDATKIVVYFIGIPHTADVQYLSGEIDAHEWVPFDDAMEKLQFKNLKELLRKANNSIRRQ